MGQSGFSGVPPESARPSKRTFADPVAKSYHLHGTGVQVDSQIPAMRKARGWGTRPRYTLVNTSARILGTGAGEVRDAPCCGRWCCSIKSCSCLHRGPSGVSTSASVFGR